jgi:hypothetical protein
MMLGERKEPHIRSTPIQKSETCSDGRRPILIEIQHMPGSWNIRVYDDDDDDDGGIGKQSNLLPLRLFIIIIPF